MMSFRLTIHVDDHDVRYVFGIGIIRGKIALENIEHCRPERKLFLGWGIKYRPGVTVYNIAGRYAIELKIKGEDKKVLLGTNDPEELSAYINSKLH